MSKKLTKPETIKILLEKMTDEQIMALIGEKLNKLNLTTDRKKLEEILYILFKAEELSVIHKSSVPNSRTTTNTTSRVSPKQQVVKVHSRVSPIQQVLVPKPTKATTKMTAIQNFMKKIQFQKGQEINFQKHTWRITEVFDMTEDTLLYKGKCVSSNPQIDVFIKVQPKKQSKTQKIIYQIPDEYFIMKQLQNGECSSNTQLPLAYGEYDEKMYILISPLYGPDLNDGNFQLNHIKRLSKKIMDALKSIHKCGIVHRDIKPGNIVFENNDTKEDIKIIDFGLSKSVYDRNGNRFNVPQYPEGTPVHKSTMMHIYENDPTLLQVRKMLHTEDDIKIFFEEDQAKRGRPMTYMDDIQGAAWTILDMMGGITWKNGTLDENGLLKAKLDFVNNRHDKPEYKVIRDLVKYTLDNVDNEIKVFVPKSKGDTDFLNKTYKDVNQILDKI